MNGDEGLNLGDVEPSWMQDGLGISGEQGEPQLDDDTPWDTLARTEGADDTQDQIGAPTNCTPPDADASKTYAWVTKYVGGKWTCQWDEVCSTPCP